MKYITIGICLMVVLLIITLDGGSNSTPLHDTMSLYSKIVESDPPNEISLTIYYLNPDILTRTPLSKEDLVVFPDVEIITIDSEELDSCWGLLKKLDSSVLQPVKEPSYMNARLCYVFKLDDSNKILEVVMNEPYGSVWVNGIEVEYNNVFYEIIDPFLPGGQGDGFA